jgi:hypothetical protein
MPTGQYLEAAGKLWPDLKSKMANWMTQAEQRDPTKVDRGEFMSFIEYINKVKGYGCVVNYKTFNLFKGKTGSEANYKGQFEKNQFCSAIKSEAGCGKEGECAWYGLKDGNDQPAQPDNYCAAFTAVAADCTGKRGCKFDKNVCRRMNDDEQIEFGWDELVSKATAQGMKAGTTKISRQIMFDVINNENPWSTEGTMKIIDSVSDLKDGITKEEYIAYTKYDRYRRSLKVQCVAKFS